MAITKEELEKFSNIHKGCAHVVSKRGDWEIVLRKPTRPEYKQYRSRHHGNDADMAQEILVRQIRVYPDTDAFDAMLEEFPGIPEALTKTVLRLCGMEAEETGK